jgi:hypothetical protein
VIFFVRENIDDHKKYFGKEVVEDSPQAGKGDVGSKQFINEFFRAFPD